MFSPRSPLLAMICTPRNTDLRFLTYSELYIWFPLLQLSCLLFFIYLIAFAAFWSFWSFQPSRMQNRAILAHYMAF